MTLCTFHLLMPVLSAQITKMRGDARGQDELDRRLQARLDALGPAPRAELLHVLMLLDLDRADRIGEFAELSIDREEDRTLRVVLVGMLREAR